MFNVLKSHMTIDNYKAFIKDYELLYHNKLCAQYKLLHSFKKKANIFAKSLFDGLNDKYNYLEYKQIVKKDIRVHTLLQALLSTKEDNAIYSAFIVELHYATEIYISFMIEYVFKQELKENNIKIVSSNYLDVIKKIDVVMNDKPVQIKNYSFISCNELTTERLKEYKNIKGIHFIFYSLEKDNICFAEIDNKVLLPLTDINDFTACLGKKNITLKETIERVKAAAA
jgi:hypothetical protein